MMEIVLEKNEKVEKREKNKVIIEDLIDSSNYRRRGRESRPKPRRQKRRETNNTKKIRRKGKMMKRVI